MASSKIEFSVKRKQAELLPPAEPTPYELKELSDIDDQDGLRFHIPVFTVYLPPAASVGNAADHVDLARKFRLGLAKAMVFYYPFAGRIREGLDRKLSAECTGEGIMFCEADADVRLEQLAGEDGVFYPPFPCMEKMVLGEGSDILNSPLLYIQITRFVCGGFIISVRFSHVMVDGEGFAMFLNAVVQLATGADTPTPLPVWERDRYHQARMPPRPSTFVYHEYMDDNPPPANETPPNHSDEPWVLDSVIFTKKDVATLRAQLPANLGKVATSFEIISACAWRCRVAALQYAPGELARLNIAVNSRSTFNPPLKGYYGNSVMSPAVSTAAKKLIDGDLGYAVELVRKVRGRVTAEYARSAVDYLVLNGRMRLVVDSAYLLSDIRRVLDTSKMDMGFGKPVYFAPADVGVNVMSFLIGIKDREGEELAVLPYRLPESASVRFKEEVKKMISVHPNFSFKLGTRQNRNVYYSRI